MPLLSHVIYLDQLEVSIRCVLPAAATLQGEEGSAPVTVMLSLSLVTRSPMSSDVLVTTLSLVTSGPWVRVIRSTISRLLSRSDLEQDQATIIRCVSWSSLSRAAAATQAEQEPGLHLASLLHWPLTRAPGHSLLTAERGLTHRIKHIRHRTPEWSSRQRNTGCSHYRHAAMGSLPPLC